MPAQVPPSVTPLPDPPDSLDTVNFSARADDWNGQIPTFSLEMQALATNVQFNANYAETQANDAETFKNDASGFADNANTSAIAAAASAASAINAPGANGTSTTSLTLGTGTKTFTTQTGKFWVVGQPVVISRTSAPATSQMYGVISAYNSGTGAMTVEVPILSTVGSGTFTDWTIGLTGKPRINLIQDAIIAMSGGVIDCSLGQNFYQAISANTTLSVTNGPSAGVGYSAQVELYHTAGTITLPSDWIWSNNLPPTLTINRRHILFFTVSNDGTKKYAASQPNYPI